MYKADSPAFVDIAASTQSSEDWTRQFTLTNKESVNSVTVKTSSEDSDALYDDISVSLTSVSPSTIEIIVSDSDVYYSSPTVKFTID